MGTNPLLTLGNAGAGFGLVVGQPNFEGDTSRQGWSYFGHGMCYGSNE